ncbi:MAG: transcription-repair coupling factor [Gammaproteobacteria bacterium]|nr:transcription-repair coupling factor [Gammaproteobacteria bacterium]
MLNPFYPPSPDRAGHPVHWSRLYGGAGGLAIARAAAEHNGPLLVVAPDSLAAARLEAEIRFFGDADDDLPVLHFPDWETLPYDPFSPHQDIISERLSVLVRLAGLERGVLVVPANTLMVRLPPRSHIDGHSLVLDRGQRFDVESMRERLERSGYRCVSQVMEHGEFAVRGAIFDLFPMGSSAPYRIDLFDDEIETLRQFDPETQRSLERVDSVRLLPAREFPLDEDAIATFRQAWRREFEGDPSSCGIYRDVSNGHAPPGVEYYLPLFFDDTQTLFDYLPDHSLAIVLGEAAAGAEAFWREAAERYENRRHDREQPLLEPARLFLGPEDIEARLNRLPRVDLSTFEDPAAEAANFATRAPVALPVEARAPDPLDHFKRFRDTFGGRILLAAESAGRREALLETFADNGLRPEVVADWQAFVAGDMALAIAVAELEQGVVIEEPPLAVVTESQLFGARAAQSRRRGAPSRDAEAVVRNLTELREGAAVVHEDHGVGRYLGLTTLDVGGMTNEFLHLEYAGGDKLYVPVSSLHLISRYTGTDPDTAPLHRLGSGQWQKARRKAAEKAWDVAAELLDLQARRAARPGHAFDIDDGHYRAFAQAFPFEETPDQQTAIEQVVADMRADRPMDRLVCGDVGFGKTEVAMRAAFIAVQGGRQVAVLVPTTLLTQQHYQNFRDRFADWPVRIEHLSRFRSKKEQTATLKALTDGRVDIIIGTHKLLGSDIHFKNLGLVVIDEEHRFGVRHKERFKALRAEVDILTLTATPIPRTLNMAMSGMRDLSLIATPPAKRLSIKTFVQQWDNTVVREACQRELRRGGQVFFLHNEVDTIPRIARELAELVPEAAVGIAHGQMPERDLERVMLDFYHRRFNVLVCTTIIETGIDIPTANTIVINRADRFGLAQLHQLRGRVGRSHHRAYAYLLVPHPKAMTADAVKRLEAVESLEDLGVGFTLATHDLEIRGAGELLGQDQSGQIHEVGFSMYADLLERAVAALKAGRSPQLDRPLDHGTEVDLHIPAIIPETYVPDVHTRLIMYKRIAAADSLAALKDLKVEMIDRFGLLPEQTQTLFRITQLKLRATPLGVRKVDVGNAGGRIIFDEQPNVDPVAIINLIQDRPGEFRLEGGDRLRLLGDMPDLDSRIHALEGVFDRLTTTAVA